MDTQAQRPLPTGVDLIHDPTLNKGTAFSKQEQRVLGLRGLVPPRVCSQDEQVLRVMGNYRRKPNELEKYIYIISLQDRNETLFYRVVMDHIEEMMPIIYTPVVGQGTGLTRKGGSLCRLLAISARPCGRALRVIVDFVQRC